MLIQYSLFTNFSINLFLIFLSYKNFFLSYDTITFVQRLNVTLVILYLIVIILYNQFSHFFRKTLILNLILSILFLEIWNYKLIYFNLFSFFIVKSNFLVNSFCSNSIMGVDLNILSFFFDKKTTVFSFVTLLISFFAIIYTSFYLRYDKNKNFFLFNLNVFTLSMLFLVKTNSFLIFFLCWEFLGISSFFLISHYHSRAYSLKSALKAFSFNRLSDAFLFLIVVSNFNLSGGFSMTFLMKPDNSITYFILALSIFVISSIKSAQNFFFFWLPDSMEAPIPASALIHSATLVSAGVYMCIRFDNLISNFFVVRVAFLLSGILSAVIFSFVSLLQNDVKKLLAYSTIANCGFMYFLISTGNCNLVLLFFTLHGLLKSFLFMFFGILIISNNHSQNFDTWFINKKQSYLLGISNFFLISLGATNLTFLFEIKHSIFYFLYPVKSLFFKKLVCSFIYIYIVNSLLYCVFFIFKINKNSNNCTVGNNQEIDFWVYKLMFFFGVLIGLITLALFCLMCLLSLTIQNDMGFNFHILSTSVVYIYILSFLFKKGGFTNKLLVYSLTFLFL